MSSSPEYFIKSDISFHLYLFKSLLFLNLATNATDRLFIKCMCCIFSHISQYIQSNLQLCICCNNCNNSLTRLVSDTGYMHIRNTAEEDTSICSKEMASPAKIWGLNKLLPKYLQLYCLLCKETGQNFGMFLFSGHTLQYSRLTPDCTKGSLPADLG